MGYAVCRRNQDRAPTFRVVTSGTGTLYRGTDFTVAVYATDENGCFLNVSGTATLSLNGADVNDALDDNGTPLSTITITNGIWTSSQVAITGGTGVDTGVAIDCDSSGFTTGTSSTFTLQHAGTLAILTHADGVDQSTSLTDVGDVPNTWTLQQGDIANTKVVIDTSQSVFGGASLRIQNPAPTVAAASNAAYAYCSDDVAFTLGSGDFTIDLRVRFDRFNTPEDTALISQRADYLASPKNAAFTFQTNPGGSELRLSVWQSESETIYGFPWTVSINTWYHVAICKWNNSMAAWLDGAQIGVTKDVTGLTVDDSTDVVSLGQAYESSFPKFLFSGFMDEIRLWNGVAAINVAGDPMYISSGDPADGFTVPTAAYDYHKQRRKSWLLAY